MKKKPLTSQSGRVRELKKSDIKRMQPAKAVLPDALLGVLPKRQRGERGPQKKPRKIALTLRYSPEVVMYFKSTGAGWQVRMDDVLKNWIKKHPKNEAQLRDKKAK